MSYRLREYLVLFVINKAFKEFGYNVIDRLQIIKTIFLLDRFFKLNKDETISGYHFIKGRLGPYSKEIVLDLDSLVDRKILKNGDAYYEYLLGESFKEKEAGIKEIEKAIFSCDDSKTRLKEILELAKDLSALLDAVYGLKEVSDREMGQEIVF